MPRKTRTAGLFRALGRLKERSELRELLVVEAELRHHVVTELRWVADVAHEKVFRVALRPFGAEVTRALVRAAGAEVRMTGRAARARADLGTATRVRVVAEPLALRPGRHRLDVLARERLLGGCVFERQDAHRDDDQDRADD